MALSNQLIPIGPYCYTIVEQIENGIKIKTCPYWQSTKIGAYCSFLNLHSENEDYFNLLWDQVKECNENLGEDECETNI